jgi:hypothetical protein
MTSGFLNAGEKERLFSFAIDQKKQKSLPRRKAACGHLLADNGSF